MARPTNKDLAIYASILLGIFGLIQQYLSLQQARVEAERLRQEQQAHANVMRNMWGGNYRSFTNPPTEKK